MQIDNIHRILKDLHTRREKKILNLAWNKARTNSSLITSQNLLDEENQLFNSLAQQLTGFREGVLLNILQLNMPTLEQIPSKVILQKQEEKKLSELSEEKQEVASSVPEQETETQQVKKVIFTNSVPKFVGTNLEIFGPYDKGDTAELPEKIVSVLVRKGRAELSS